MGAALTFDAVVQHSCAPHPGYLTSLPPAQVAGVRSPVLPGCPTRARGGGIQQPRCLGSGSALRGIAPSAQNRKYGPALSQRLKGHRLQ